MTQREAFEAWAKSQNLDPDHKEKDAWGRDVYSPHIHSMWCGWQAAQAQAAVEPADRLADTGETMPVAYLAWRDGNPCYEGDDAVCEDAVWPVDFDDDRTSMPVYTSPPDHTAEIERLTKCLKKANSNHEEFERLWYLATDKSDSQKASMRLALEALSNSVDLVWEEYTEAERSYGNYTTRRAKLDGMKAMAQQHTDAIAALEGALK